MDSIVTWLARTLHVLGAAAWVGGYAVMALVIVPLLAKGPNEQVLRVALAATRVLSFSGVLTLLAGAFLVTRSRGYGQLFRGEWGGIVVTAIALALALLAVGDGGLRPALRRLESGEGGSPRAAQRWATIGLLLGVAAVAIMTRAIYAPT